MAKARLKAVGGCSQIHPRSKIEANCSVFKLCHLGSGLQAVRRLHEEDDREEEEGFFFFYFKDLVQNDIILAKSLIVFK